MATLDLENVSALAGLGKQVKYDEVIHSDNEFEQIQQCKGMYCSYERTKGAFHLVKEETNNHFDELTSDEMYKYGGTIEIFADLQEQSVTQSDNGRGIPIPKLVEVFTRKHSSTKIGRKFNPFSAGQNGIGLKLIVALSDYLSVTTYNGFESKTLEFDNHQRMTEHKVKKEKTEKYGTIVKFIPSEKHLGKIDMTQDMFEDWYRRLSYLVPNKITFVLHIKLKDGTKVKRIYKPQPISENVKFLSLSLDCPIIQLGGSWDSDNENDIKRTKGLELNRDKQLENIEDLPVDENGKPIIPHDRLEFNLAFSYDKTLTESLYNTYCNYVYTIDNGEHLDGAKAALCSFFSREAKKMDPNSKYPINWDDVCKGLILCLDCKYTRPEFGGQTKEKVTNSDVGKIIRNIVDEKLREYFATNQGTLKKIISYLRVIAKARQEVNKIRKLPTQKQLTFLDDYEIPGFINIEDRNYSGYTELYIVEGDSAGYNIAKLCNPKYQAVFSVFGVLDSTIDLETDELIKKHSDKQKSTVMNLVKVLGCGIGKSFDINKLRWSKIIICTDKDIDGDNITSSTSAFFQKHLPQLVEYKKVYKVIPPLYMLSTTGKSKSLLKGAKHGNCAFSKNDYINMYQQIVASSVDVMYCPEDYPGARPMSKDGIVKWLQTNEDYLQELERLVKRSYCYPEILERVCYEFLEADFDEKSFSKAIKKYFPELDYDFTNHMLTGSYNGESITLITDRIFFKNAEPFMDVLRLNDACRVGVKRKDKGDECWETVTLYQALYQFDVDYKVKVDQRFKGLGEMGDDILFATVVNPLTRKLIRLENVKSADEALNTMKILHSRKIPEERRNILSQNRFKYSDIDN